MTADDPSGLAKAVVAKGLSVREIERLRETHMRYQRGYDEARIASQVSAAVSRGEGGDLGWVTPGEMVPEFEQVMDQLGNGQISEPVQSRFGWHLIQVLARREHDDTAEFRRNRARESIRQRKTDEELEIWLRRLRDESYVEYIVDES